MSRIIRGFVLIFLWIITTPSSFAQTQAVVIPAPGSLDANGRPSAFFESALRLALAKTADQGEIDIHYFSHRPEKERLRKMLIQGQGIDIIWSSTTAEREKDMLAIKFNLLQGINDYHLLLIRSEDQSKFESITQLDQLRHFTVGTGIHWSDTDILKDNGFNCFVTGDYENMFSGLRRKRFDFMVRGIHEIDTEVSTYAPLQLAVANNLLLHYPQAVYFFLNKQNKKLATRIEKGLTIAAADGSFFQLFLQYPEFFQAAEKINQLKSERILLELANK